MFKIWAKLIDEDRRIVKDCVFECQKPYNEKELFSYLTEICQKIDISVPTILKYHQINFTKFSFVKFQKRDFIDDFPYNALMLEHFFDEKKK